MRSRWATSASSSMTAAPSRLCSRSCGCCAHVDLARGRSSQPSRGVKPGVPRGRGGGSYRGHSNNFLIRNAPTKRPNEEAERRGRTKRPNEEAERRGFLPSGPDDTAAALDKVKGGPRRQEQSLNETAPRYGDSIRNLPRKTAALAVADWLVNASRVAVGGGGVAPATGPLPHVGDEGDACLDCVGVS